MLQGVFVFCIFVLKRNVFQEIQKKFGGRVDQNRKITSSAVTGNRIRKASYASEGSKMTQVNSSADYSRQAVRLLNNKP